MLANRSIKALMVMGVALGAGSALAQEYDSVESLGEALFHDTDLSANRTQSCATCHDPDFAFVDPRETDAGRAVSLGDDGVSLGDRTAPTAAYAAFVPPFGQNEDGIWQGGMFWDGRAASIEDQAGGPPLNPIEMGMPDKASVVARLQEKPDYIQAFKTYYGDDVFDDPDKAYTAMTKAIGAFERTEQFAPFDSKYDRYLRGEAKFTHEEELGRLLFFSQQFTNCNMCHQLQRSAIHPQETFSNNEYHNIGTPENLQARSVNGVAADFVDDGLLANPAIDDPKQRGKYKVPTLRNIAVTGPYMHNGVFKDLRTVVLFYNKYNSKSEARQINPETGEPFGPPEVDGTLSMEELETGPALDDKRIDALVAFMKTLTDARYVDLMED